MDAKTAEALEKSIKHREAERDKLSPSLISIRGEQCALCDLFYFSAHPRPCSGCPVKEHTGSVMCGGSPYDAACTALHRWRSFPVDIDRMEAWVQAAQAEIDFLKSLREEPT